jgi:tetratricopeptide (TPR) repeat protein
MLDLVASEVSKAVIAAAGGIVLRGSEDVLSAVRRRLPGVTADDEQALTRVVLSAMAQSPALADEMSSALAGPARVGGETLRPPVFFDRDEVRRAAGEPGCWLIAGAHGTGKTALVTRIAADSASRFGAVAMVDLDGYREGNALRIAEAKRAVLSQLGVPAIEVPAPELDWQYELALLHRRFVLIVENILDSGEAGALALPWPQSLVLVTTRNLADDLRMWSAEKPIALQGLEEAGAYEMLASQCGESMLEAEPILARELLRRCGYLPYAVMQAGALLARHRDSGFALPELLADLPSGDGGSLVEYCVSRSLRDLSAEAQRTAELLACHPGQDFTRDSAKAMHGNDFVVALDELIVAKLVQELTNGRFQFHQLARSHARRLRSGVDVNAAFDRILGYYRDRAVAVDLAEGQRLRRYVIPEVASAGPLPGRIDWLESEAAVLVDLVGQAYERERDVEVTQLCGAFEVLLNYRGHHRLCIAVNEWGVKSAARLGDRALEARLYAMQGRVFTLIHEFDFASAALGRAMELLGLIDDQQLLASTLEFAARLHEERAAYDDGGTGLAEAMEYLRRAITLDVTLADSVAHGLHLRMLANVLVKAGQPAEALAVLGETADYQLTDRNRSRVHTVQAKALAALGDFAGAQAQIDAARALAGEVGATQYECDLVGIEAEIARKSGDIEAARARLGWLAGQYYAMGSNRFSLYLDQLRKLPSP